MATTKNNSSNSHPITTATTTTTSAKKRTKARKPPVAERVTVSAPPVAAPTPPPATPAPAKSSSGTATPATPPATTGSSSGAATGGGLLIAAPPSVTIPAVPSGFVPINAADLLGFRVMASQVAAVPDAIAELQSFANYTAVFGITAPDVGQLTQRLAVAQQWTMLLSQTAAWYKYTKSQQGMAWKDALLLVDTLTPAFDLASTANPAMLSQYPAIARMLGARSVVAKRAASTRAKDKAVVQAAVTASASGAAATSSAPVASATAPAAVEADGAAATPAPAGRVVTVQG